MKQSLRQSAPARSLAYLLALFALQGFNYPVPLCAQLVLHLHRLQYQQGLPLADRLPLLDQHGYHYAVHGRDGALRLLVCLLMVVAVLPIIGREADALAPRVMMKAASEPATV